jgi:hypothetical protein
MTAETDAEVRIDRLRRSVRLLDFALQNALDACERGDPEEMQKALAGVILVFTRTMSPEE